MNAGTRTDNYDYRIYKNPVGDYFVQYDLSPALTLLSESAVFSGRSSDLLGRHLHVGEDPIFKEPGRSDELICYLASQEVHRWSRLN